MSHTIAKISSTPLRIALLTTICLAFALPSLAASVTTTGLVSSGAGTVGHGSLEPTPAPFDANNTSVQLASHPASGYLASVYALLASRDVFNTSDGSEAALGSHAAPFAGNGLPDVDLIAMGVTGTVYYSLRGFHLNHLDGDDFNFNLSTNTESRLYRGGEIEFYYDSGAGPVVFARSLNAVFEISINWNTFAITQTLLSSIADTSPSLPTIITSSVGISSNPVQITGTTSEGAPYSGAYGVFNDDGTTWGFAANPQIVAVENVPWGSIKATFAPR